MDYFEKTLTSQSLYQGKIIDLKLDRVELENGATATREVVVHPGGVGVLALDEQDNVLLVRQYRYGAGRELLEIPAGKLNPGEDPAVCGRRELEEETGCTAGSYEPLGCLHPTPAYVTEVIHLYLARELGQGEQNLDPDEFLSVERVPLCRAVELCLSGEITDAKTLVAILKYAAMTRENTDSAKF